jgi:predicted porin
METTGAARQIRNHPMKKTVCTFVFLTWLCAAAQAQQVTLYGSVDAGMVHTTGLKGGTSTVVASGIMEGSRFGLRGQEDLGGGYSAIFNLENRAYIDTGDMSARPLSGLQLPDRLSIATLMGLPAALQPIVTQVANNLATQEAGTNLPKRLFDRQATIGLVTPYGAVLMGRMGNPAAEVSGTFDIMRTQSSLSAGQVLSIPEGVNLRSSNALSYRIKLDGLSASVLWGFGEVAGADTKNRLVGAQAIYQGKGFAVGAGYQTRNNELGQKSLTNAAIAGSVEFGSNKLTALYVTVKDPNPTGLSTIAPALAGAVPAATGAAVQNAFINAAKQDGHLIHLGYRHEVGPHAFFVAFNRFNDNRPANADTDTYGVAWTYSLSNRTNLNAVYTRYNNKNLAQTAPGQSAFLGGVTAKAGQDADSYAVAIRHRF